MTDKPMERSCSEIARELIDDFDEEVCSECEGSGLVYADRKAHYPYENAKTVPCSYCHEGKRAISNETRIEMVANTLQSKQKTIEELRAEVARLKKAETDLDTQLAIQANEPTTKTDSYMAGLLNGMLLAKANFGHEHNPISYKTPNP